MLEPVRESYRKGEPLHWNRVHNLQQFVYFDHSIHVNKGVGLAKVAELFDIPLEKFAAFGDGENDVTMLEMAGTGIAVGNADPKAQAAASYVAKQPYGLGVVEGLRYLQLL